MYLAYRMEPKLESSGDSEIAATTADCPEQVLVLFGVHPRSNPISSDYLRREEVVAQSAMLTHKPAEAASKSKSGDANRGTLTENGSQTMGRSRSINTSYQKTSLDARNTFARID